jgi:hypothetical protein
MVVTVITIHKRKVVSHGTVDIFNSTSAVNKKEFSNGSCTCHLKPLCCSLTVCQLHNCLLVKHDTRSCK